MNFSTILTEKPSSFWITYKKIAVLKSIEVLKFWGFHYLLTAQKKLSINFNDMKKTNYLFLLVFIMIGFFSCDSSDEKLQENQINLPEKISIEKEEVPDVSDYFVSDNKSTIQFEYDDDRESILNTSKNELRIPVKIKTNKSDDANKTITGKMNISKSQLPRICICIARKKPKTGCNSCVDCLGFRCSGCCAGPPSQKNTGSRSRTQMVSISHDKNSNEIVFKFGDIDWDYLASSEL